MALGGLALVTLCLYGSVSWYMADLIRDHALTPNHDPGERNLVIRTLDDKQIRLQTLAPNEFDFATQSMGMPTFLRYGSKALAHWRFDVPWSRLNYLSRVQLLQTPILLFHGETDAIVPVTTSDALAMARPDLVQYERSDQAEHIRQWNLNLQQYEARLREFLQTLDDPA